MNRRTLTIILILLALVVLIVGIYLMFFDKAPIDQNPTFNQPYAPFGTNTGTSTDLNGGSIITSTSTYAGNTTAFGTSTGSPLVKISTAPIAGAGALSIKVGTTTIQLVEYTERATGHTLQYNLQDKSLNPVTITTIPQVIKAVWSKNNVLLQYTNNNTVQTLYGSILATTTATTTQVLVGTTLQNTIDSLVVSPDSTKLFYLTKNFSAAKGLLSNIDGSKATDIFDFPFNEWNVSWPTANTLTLTTKASANVAGYLYFLTTKGFLSKVMGNINGLTTLTNPSLAYVLYSTSANNSIQTGIYDVKNNKYLAMNNPTLPEKCVWSTKDTSVAYCAIPTVIPSGSYPDDWYQGNVSFSDNIYKIDLSVSTASLLYTLPANQAIDATNLFLDPAEDTLFFTNKKDYYLWALNIGTLIPNL